MIKLFLLWWMLYVRQWWRLACRESRNFFCFLLLSFSLFRLWLIHIQCFAAFFNHGLRWLSKWNPLFLALVWNIIDWCNCCWLTFININFIRNFFFLFYVFWILIHAFQRFFFITCFCCCYLTLIKFVLLLLRRILNAC